MTFLSPARLLLLLLVAGLAAAYLWAQRRRSAYAVRFTELELLASVAPRSPGWRRHVPAGLLLLSMVLLTTGFARPQAEVQVPRERATVLVALDTSISMRADDVAPSRNDAARSAAAAFVERLPERFHVGLVSFAEQASVAVPPTLDHEAVERFLGGLPLEGGTAIGDAVLRSLDALRQVPGEPGQELPPARIVLLSDGANTAGASLEEAASAARDAGVPVSTIAYGTQDGTVEVEGRTVPVPVDSASLQQLAELTGGTAYTAETGEELSAVYDDIGSQVGMRTERQEVSAWFAGAGLLAAALAATASLLWFARLP
jgi:Ca-activated chloride channel family protein